MMAFDPKQNKIKCYLKKCQTPLLPVKGDTRANSSIITGPHVPCRPPSTAMAEAAGVDNEGTPGKGKSKGKGKGGGGKGAGGKVSGGGVTRRRGRSQ